MGFPIQLGMNPTPPVLQAENVAVTEAPGSIGTRRNLAAREFGEALQKRNHGFSGSVILYRKMGFYICINDI